MTEDAYRTIADILDHAETVGGDDSAPLPTGDDDAPRSPRGDAAPDPLDLRLARLPANDTGNAGRLMARFGDRFRFVRDVGPFVWTGTHWDGVGGHELMKRLAQQTAAAIKGEARALREGGLLQGETPADFDKRVGRHSSFGNTSGNAGRVAAMVDMAAPHCTVSPDDLDTDPLRLNAENGTLTFALDRDGEARVARVELQPHARDDLISKCMPVAYDAQAAAPRWRAFLDRIIPDADVRLFLQVWAGYCLTGLVTEQKLVFFYGAGANGKSTFVDILARMLAGYGASLRFESLAGDQSRRGDAATPDLARLPGVRFLRAAEPEQGMRFKEAEVKAITGGEPLLVRHLHGRFFELRPVFKLILSGNHRPDIRGLDEGIWRRILLVPFTVTVPKEERDPALPDKLWAERAGILNWALDGLRIYLEDGLAIPQAVTAATAEYRDDSDPLGAFLRDCTDPDPDGFVTARDLFKAFLAWCEANAVRPWSESAFGRAMPQKGVTRTNERVRRYLGIRLRDDAPKPPMSDDDAL